MLPILDPPLLGSRPKQAICDSKAVEQLLDKGLPMWLHVIPIHLIMLGNCFFVNLEKYQVIAAGPTLNLLCGGQHGAGAIVAHSSRRNL